MKRECGHLRFKVGGFGEIDGPFDLGMDIVMASTGVMQSA